MSKIYVSGSSWLDGWTYEVTNNVYAAKAGDESPHARITIRQREDERYVGSPTNRFSLSLSEDEAKAMHESLGEVLKTLERWRSEGRQ